MGKIKQTLEEKIAIRKSIEDRITADIRNGKELVKKDLDAIFALSLVITTLEEMNKKIIKICEAIEFAEWIRIKDFQTASKDNWIGLDMKYYTTEELFEQFNKK